MSVQARRHVHPYLQGLLPIPRPPCYIATDPEIFQNPTLSVTDVPGGSTKRVRFTEEAAIQDLWERAEKILAIRESEELAEEAVRLGRMVSSHAPLY